MSSNSARKTPRIEVLTASQEHAFAVPSKRINEGSDVSLFHVSYAYRDILALIAKLNRSMFPLLDAGASEGQVKSSHSFSLASPPIPIHPVVKSLQEMINDINAFIEQTPPVPGPRRFGNIGFRTWYQLVEDRCTDLLLKHLPHSVTDFPYEGTTNPVEEIRIYLLGSFGSAQRLDYGTGHELSFLAFIGCIWKLGGFGLQLTDNDARQIVIGVVQPYLTLVRKLILTYTLEPAGTHGVWGLDDHSFAPYIFGSAQFGPAIAPDDPTPTEGSIRGAPDPGKITSTTSVEHFRETNMYFSAIGFINDVKKGPFWEHSPTLYDISGVRAGWGKINKGMLKMYDAEVLGKFPVVQHFPFGSLFCFDRDPDAKSPVNTIHAQSQPTNAATAPTAPLSHGPPAEVMAAPWAINSQTRATALPAPSSRNAPPNQPDRTHDSSSRAVHPSPSSKMPPPTRAPWAK